MHVVEHYSRAYKITLLEKLWGTGNRALRMISTAKFPFKVTMDSWFPLISKTARNRNGYNQHNAFDIQGNCNSIATSKHCGYCLASLTTTELVYKEHHRNIKILRWKCTCCGNFRLLLLQRWQKVDKWCFDNQYNASPRERVNTIPNSNIYQALNFTKHLLNYTFICQQDLLSYLGRQVRLKWT